MNKLTRRRMFRLCMAAPLAVRQSFGSSRRPSNKAIDWSRLVVSATIERKPDPATLGGWGYAIALFLYGTYLIYQRTGDQPC
jgi:unsaturated rhamnogalacturonyl hydrolase